MTYIPDIKPNQVGTYTDNDGKKHTLHGEKLTLRDSSMFDASEPSAQSVRDAEAVKLRSEAEQQEQQRLAQERYDDMTSTEKRIFIEQKYIPLIEQAESEHAAACDAIEDFTANEQSFKELAQRNFAFMCKHPDVRIIACSGEYHRNFLLKSGELYKDGYRPVDQRDKRIICIPAGVPDLLSYAASPEAVASAQADFDRAKDKLIRNRDKAAVRFVAIKAEAQTLWDSVKDITSYFDTKPKSKK